MLEKVNEQSSYQSEQIESNLKVSPKEETKQINFKPMELKTKVTGKIYTELNKLKCISNVALPKENIVWVIKFR